MSMDRCTIPHKLQINNGHSHVTFWYVNSFEALALPFWLKNVIPTINRLEYMLTAVK